MTPKLKHNQSWNVTQIDTSTNLKCHLNWNVTKTKMSTKVKCPKNKNITKKDMTSKTEMSPKLKCHYKNVKKTFLSPRLKYQKTEISLKTEIFQNWRKKLKCPQNWNVTKTEISSNLKCYQNWNVIKTEMSLELINHLKWNVTKTEIVLYNWTVMFNSMSLLLMALSLF